MTQDEEDLRADWRDDVASGSTELSFLTWAEERKLGAEFERSCQWRSFDVTLVECTEIRYELGTREAFTPEQAFKDAYMWFKDQPQEVLCPLRVGLESRVRSEVTDLENDEVFENSSDGDADDE